MSEKIPGWEAIFVGKDLEADLLKPLLMDNGIQAQILSTQGRGFTLNAGNVLEDYTVFVPEEQAGEARQLVAAFFQRD
ncbi:MAG: hypothetical protein SPK23_03655 [Eubacteriales bacterium]|nr:hypothetical protein [Clostridiales bacterium]MDY5836203.1 hypothetical protein [Eubacteriales bacterium]